MLAVECPTKLYFTGKDTEYQNLMKEDSFLEMLADGGFQVGAKEDYCAKNVLLLPHAKSLRTRARIIGCFLASEIA